MTLEEAAASLCRHYGANDSYPDWPVTLDCEQNIIYLYCAGRKPRQCFDVYHGYQVIYVEDTGVALKQ